ncbi:hypothetical protein SLEP1_g34597 [Rubroshorea leprosula]|uniref:Uncharacterized protein n=1 Tax=Rubroshorea leprosula TaxID=152421 RepID=A0AAV5KKH5_9ROSI|nr:hypothetical protein SLEP1_g34597 [Rubroshorea leprosula]
MRSPEPNSSSSKQLKIKFVVQLMALCSKNVKRVSNKLKALPSDIAAKSPGFHLPIKSTLGRVKPKKLLKTISKKAIMFAHRKKKSESGGEEEFGDGGVWQREIMMGDKCQPLDFSGVIYYDSSGKRVAEIPARSPRTTSASPIPAYLSETRKTDL